jgi:hypothetical protein
MPLGNGNAHSHTKLKETLLFWHNSKEPKGNQLSSTNKRTLLKYKSCEKRKFVSAGFWTEIFAILLPLKNSYLQI